MFDLGCTTAGWMHPGFTARQAILHTAWQGRPLHLYHSELKVERVLVVVAHVISLPPLPVGPAHKKHVLVCTSIRLDLRLVDLSRAWLTLLLYWMLRPTHQLLRRHRCLYNGAGS